MNGNSSRLKELEAQATARGKRLAEEFQAKVNSLKDKIGDLQQQKVRVTKGKISRTEAVERMKEDLKKGREEWVKEGFLRPHLATYQQQVRTLGNLDHLQVHTAQGVGWFAFVLFSLINEEMIDEISKSLPEGLTEKERMKRIEELDKEIIKVESEMENLLK